MIKPRQKEHQFIGIYIHIGLYINIYSTDITVQLCIKEVIFFCSEISLCFYLQVTIQFMTDDDRERVWR